MSNHSIIFIGLDTHKESTDVACSLDQRDDKATHLGKIKTNKQAFVKLTRQLQSKYPRATLHFVYEAGPCGYWVHLSGVNYSPSRVIVVISSPLP